MTGTGARGWGWGIGMGMGLGLGMGMAVMVGIGVQLGMKMGGAGQNLFKCDGQSAERITLIAVAVGFTRRECRLSTNP